MPPSPSGRRSKARIMFDRQARILRQYVAWTSILYALGVAAVVWPGSRFITDTIVGGLAAVALGIGALVLLHRSDPSSGRFAAATAMAMAATPAAMAFNETLVAQVMTTIAALLLAMYLAAFNPFPRGPILVIAFTCAVIGALIVAPAQLSWITYVALAASILLSAQMYGSLMNALIYSASTDPLTGLLNRAGLELATIRALARCRTAQPVPVSLGILDVDRLKDVNDTLGHDAGDVLLMQLGLHLRGSFPPGTVIARIGGDEFVVFCVQVDQKKLFGLLTAVAAKSPTTFTFGICTTLSTSVHWPDMYRQADTSLYQAKRQRP
ncbi:hypothetical protein CH292_21060 [Rhodococcus sp. 14-2470-1a]|nr:hypothetical protein CH292_21060 [Rhodococcus sp. 14-2470-1a]